MKATVVPSVKKVLAGDANDFIYSIIIDDKNVLAKLNQDNHSSYIAAIGKHAMSTSPSAFADTIITARRLEKLIHESHIYLRHEENMLLGICASLTTDIQTILNLKDAFVAFSRTAK